MSVSQYENIFIFIYVQVKLFESRILVVKSITVATASVCMKYMSEFKTILRCLPRKYNKEHIFCHWLSKRLCDLTFYFQQGRLSWVVPPKPLLPPPLG